MDTMKFSTTNKRQFFIQLRKKVNSYFRDNNIAKTGNAGSYIKAVVMFSLYLVPYILMVMGYIRGVDVIWGFAIIGLGKAGIGLSVMHDANHDSFSRHQIVNDILSYSMNLIGGSSFTWKVQHNVLHHSYTNVYHLDEDIDDKPFLRLSPFGKLKSYHKYQHLYALVIYCFATVSWLGFKDFRQLKRYNETGLTREQGYNPKIVSIIMTSSKVLYFFAVLVAPMIFFAKWYIALAGFLTMHIVAGFIITVIFQLAHVVERTEHHSTEEGLKSENSWAIHQITTTADFARGNKLLTWFCGGLNHQVEHHLFPEISHIHYAKIAEIVKETALEFELPYNDYKSMGEALKSHLRTLKLIGSGKLTT